MSPLPGGVPAAPNRCEINARVQNIEQSDQFPDRWHFELEILEAKDVEGPNFARGRIGQTVRAYTVGSPPKFSPGQAISAQAEFIGDERGGQFQLYPPIQIL